MRGFDVSIDIRFPYRTHAVGVLLDEFGRIDWDDLVRVMEADRLVEDAGGSASVGVMADEPVVVGDVEMYRPSLMALAIARRAEAWCEGVMLHLLLAYVCAFARDRLALMRLATPAAAMQAVGDWAERLTVTMEELDAAREAAFGGFPVAGGKHELRGTSELSDAAVMAHEYGGGVGHWQWDMSAQAVAWICREMDNRQSAGDVPAGQTIAKKAWIQLRTELRRKYEADPDTAAV